MNFLRSLLLLVGLAALASGKFTKLRETCRAINTGKGLNSPTQLGICVQSPFCCRAVGGETFDVVNPKIQDRSMPPELRSTGEPTHGCSYSGSCCVLPELSDPDCSICGLKGNGDLDKAVTDPPIPIVTTPPAAALKKIQERIVDGDAADENEWCWQVAILNQTGLIGGGALISRNWVITAAHVVAGLFLDEFIIGLGLHGFTHEADSGDEVFYTTALNVLLHPEYNPMNHDSDLALIKIPDAPCDRDSVCPVCLGEPFEFEPIVPTEPPVTTVTSTEATTTTTFKYGSPDGAVQLTFDAESAFNRAASRTRGGRPMPNGGFMPAPPENKYSDLVCFMTGWGSTGTSAVAPVLQETSQTVISFDDCTEDFASLNVPRGKIVQPQRAAFCTRDGGLNTGSCIGDGGGPLVCQDKSTHEWRLHGVIILGLNMCMPDGNNGPTVFTNVGLYENWIRDMIHQAPSGPGESFGRKAYKVPECGATAKEMNDDICPEKLHPF